MTRPTYISQTHTILLISLNLLCSAKAYAADTEATAHGDHLQDYGGSMDLHTFAGSGELSSASGRSRTSGVTLQVRKTYALNSEWSLGPVVSGSFSKTDVTDSGPVTEKQEYKESRFEVGAAAMKSLGRLSENTAAFWRSSATAGKVFASLHQDIASEKIYTQYRYSGISGNSAALQTELGMTVAERLQVGFGMTAQYARLDQRDATGTVDSVAVVGGATNYLSEDVSAEAKSLDDFVFEKSLTLSLTCGFTF